MGRPQRHSRKTPVSAPEDLAAGLPEHLRNPNCVGNGITLDEHQRAIADYLRTEGISLISQRNWHRTYPQRQGSLSPSSSGTD